MSKSPLTLSIVHSTNGKEKEKERKSPQHIVSLLPESWWCTHTTRRVCMCVCLPLGRPQTFYVNKQYHLRFWLVWFPYGRHELKSLLKTIPSRAIEKEKKVGAYEGERVKSSQHLHWKQARKKWRSDRHTKQFPAISLSRFKNNTNAEMGFVVHLILLHQSTHPYTHMLAKPNAEMNYFFIFSLRLSPTFSMSRILVIYYFSILHQKFNHFLHITS